MISSCNLKVFFKKVLESYQEVIKKLFQFIEYTEIENIYL